MSHRTAHACYRSGMRTSPRHAAALPLLYVHVAAYGSGDAHVAARYAYVGDAHVAAQYEYVAAPVRARCRTHCRPVRAHCRSCMRTSPLQYVYTVAPCAHVVAAPICACRRSRMCTLSPLPYTHVAAVPMRTRRQPVRAQCLPHARTLPLLYAHVAAPVRVRRRSVHTRCRCSHMRMSPLPHAHVAAAPVRARCRRPHAHTSPTRARTVPLHTRTLPLPFTPLARAVPADAIHAARVLAGVRVRGNARRCLRSGKHQQVFPCARTPAGVFMWMNTRRHLCARNRLWTFALAESPRDISTLTNTCWCFHVHEPPRAFLRVEQPTGVWKGGIHSDQEADVEALR
ncbi:hypothetical protein GGX14DRAFT_576222 [Mycena pura]|uniref:Uncharacterized protein n=1 Tax=Mycena pura TaxID=153505 RepID=A0AAD6UTT4_9AGAR|nr:hypothetical protein GGX14DRAFT_576222 [Mycena pura]